MHYATPHPGSTPPPCPAYSITTVTFRKRQMFHSLALARRVVDEMKGLHDAGRVSSLAWVIMPAHVHWLIRPGPHQPLDDLVQQFMHASAQSINQCLCERGPVWEKTYANHRIQRQEDLRRVARFIVADPLRAGLVERIGNYPLWDAAWL